MLIDQRPVDRYGELATVRCGLSPSARAGVGRGDIGRKIIGVTLDEVHILGDGTII